MKYKTYELVSISPWMYAFNAIVRGFWEILNSRFPEAMKTLLDAYSMVPLHPPALKAVMISSIVAISEKVSEESVYRRHMWTLRNIYGKIKESNEVFCNISRLVMYSLGQITEEEIRNYEKEIPEGVLPTGRFV